MSNELKPEPVKKRPRYFDGQYLKVDDFVDEQAYHIDRQRRISQFLHVSGILEGLQVTIENNLLQITPGAAIDNAGRQILFTGEATYRTQILKSSQNPFEIDLSLSKLDSTTHNLSIAWAEVGSDEQSDGGSQEKTRIYELPEIVIRPASESLSSSVLLAVLKGKGAGNSFELDLTSRQYSGLKLPTTNGQGITLRSQNGASDRAILSSSLSVTQNLQVDGNVGIGGASGTERLKVGGNTAIAGSLSITGTSNNLTVDGNVGIGTSSIQNPKLYNRLLDILGSNNAALSVRSTGGITTSMVSHDSFGGRASIGTDTKHKFELRTNDIPRMTIATDGKVGIGGDPDATEKLKVTGNAIIAGNLSVTGTSTLSGNTTIAGALSTTGTNGNLTVAGTSTLNGNTTIAGTLSTTGTNSNLTVAGTSTLNGNTTIAGNLTVAGKYVVQDNVDGGNTRGIFMWNANDYGWGIYMGASGASKSLAAGQAIAGKGFTSHAIRLRTYSNAGNGLIYENSSEALNLSIRASDGRTYIRGNTGIGADPTDAETLKVGGNTAIEGDLSIKGIGEINFGSRLGQLMTLWKNPSGLAEYGIGMQGSTQYFRTGQNFAWYQGGSHVDTELSAGTGGTAQMVINNGNVGIGTSSLHNPQGWNKVVDILGTTNARLNVRSSGGVVTSMFSHDNWEGARGVIGTESNHPLTFATGYTHRMTISADGNVSIVGNLSVNKLTCTEKPIQMKKIVGGESSNATNIDTGYPSDTWICSVAGFTCNNGDIYEKDGGMVIDVSPNRNNNSNWFVNVNFRVHGRADWTIWILAIKRDLATTIDC